MYKIVFKKKAQKELEAVPKQYFIALSDAIDGLAKKPRPAGCKKLIGADNQYRIRVGMYRILYTIEDNILTITVVKVAHRKEVYN